MHKLKKKRIKRRSLLLEEKDKDKKTYIDDLFLRIFLSSLLLLGLCTLDKYYPKSNLLINLNDNFNIVKLTKIFANTPLELIKEDEVVTVYETDIYDEVKYLEGINYVSNITYAGVDNLVSGYVVKILKEYDNNNLYYSVYIKGADGLEYKYIGLESIDVSLYKFIDAKSTIGKAKFINNKYQFSLIIDKKGEKINFYDH